MNKWIANTFILIIVAASGLKLFTIDKRVLWSEEVYALDMISGRENLDSMVEKTRALVQTPTTAEEIGRLVNIEPGTTLNDTLQFAYKNDLRHLSLHYGVLYFVARWFGEGTVTMRMVSFGWSTLALIALWLLGTELRLSRTAKLVGLTLFSIGTVFFFYGQVVREYAMWSMMIPLAHLSFLRARRQNNIASWSVYGLVMTLSLYTQFMSALIFPAHAILIWTQNRRREELKAYILTSAITLALFAPFLWALMDKSSHVDQANAFKDIPGWSITYYLPRLASSLGRALFETSLDKILHLTFTSGAIILALIFARAYADLRERGTAYTLLVLVAIPMAVFIAHDVLTASIAITYARITLVFMMPLTLLIGVRLAPWLKARDWKSSVIALTLVVLAGISLTHLSRRDHLKMMRHPGLSGAANAQVDAVISFAGRSVKQWIGLGRALEPATPWWVLPPDQLPPDLPFDTILVYKPEERLIRAYREGSLELQRRFLIRPQFSHHYWILTRRDP